MSFLNTLKIIYGFKGSVFLTIVILIISMDFVLYLEQLSMLNQGEKNQ